MRIRTAGTLAAFLSAIGFFDAGYLTALHFLESSAACSPLARCDAVLKSAYAAPVGIPLALIGALYYLLLFALALRARREPSPRLIVPIVLVSGAGFFISLALIYLQWQVIYAWCMYCLISAAVTTLIFLVGIYAIWKIRKI